MAGTRVASTKVSSMTKTPSMAKMSGVTSMSSVTSMSGVTSKMSETETMQVETNTAPETEMLSEIMIGKGRDFERIRRITGYLVGTIDRWNDAKRSEEKDRVKHTISFD